MKLLLIDRGDIASKQSYIAAGPDNVVRSLERCGNNLERSLVLDEQQLLLFSPLVVLVTGDRAIDQIVWGFAHLSQILIDADHSVCDKLFQSLGHAGGARIHRTNLNHNRLICQMHVRRPNAGQRCVLPSNPWDLGGNQFGKYQDRQRY